MAIREQPRAIAGRNLRSAGSVVSTKYRYWVARLFGAQSPLFYRLLLITLLLVAIGLVMVLSSSSIDSLVTNQDSYYVFGRQLFFAAVGLTVMLAASALPIAFFRKNAKFLFAGTLGLQFLVVFTPLGTQINGNRNWLNLGFATIQPSEFLKLGLILLMAHLMAQRVSEIENEKRFTHPTLLLAGAGIAVVLFGADFGTTVVMALIAIFMVLLAGAPIASFRLPILVVLTVGVLAVLSSPSRVSRIAAWLNPAVAGEAGQSWQFEHGTWALAAGGLFGVGLGQSKLKWNWIPEVENDFIFAIIGEELGLIGALTIIGVYLALAAAFMKLVRASTDPFVRFASTGIMLWVVVQAMVNIGVVLGVFPVLGVPLPLMSAGGSSMIAILAAIGIVLAFEREQHAESNERGGLQATPRLKSVK